MHSWLLSNRDVRSYVNISSHKSKSCSANCINYYQNEGLQHIIHDAVLGILQGSNLCWPPHFQLPWARLAPRSNTSDCKQLFINNSLTTCYPRRQAQNMSLFTISVNDAGCCLGLGWLCGWVGGRRLLPIVRVKIYWQGVAKVDNLSTGPGKKN